MAATFGGDCVLCEMNFGRTSRIGSGIMVEFWHDKWWYHLSPLFFMPQVLPKGQPFPIQFCVGPAVASEGYGYGSQYSASAAANAEW
jgi:hypothetical protein